MRFTHTNILRFLTGVSLAVFMVAGVMTAAFSNVYAEEPVFEDITDDAPETPTNLSDSTQSESKTPTAAVTPTPTPAAPSDPNAPNPATLLKVYGERKKIRVEWQKQTKKVDGYQIQYSTLKRMKNAKKLWVTDKQKESRTIKGLKENKTYYVQIRTYRKVKGKRYYSEWSNKMKAKTLPVTSLPAPELKFVDWCSGTQISARWTAVSGAVGYDLYRSTTRCGTAKKVASNSGYTKVRSIISAPRNKICYYTVKAYKIQNGRKVYGELSNAVKCVKYKQSHLGELFPTSPPTSAGGMAPYLTTISVPIKTPGGGKAYKRLEVHKKLAKEITAIFEEMYKAGFPIKSGDTDSYDWRRMRTANLISHHSYGCVVDINWDDNPMASFYEIGHCAYRPGSNRYSIPKKVVEIWKNHGFYWGGDWTEKKDYMHMTYTNN